MELLELAGHLKRDLLKGKSVKGTISYLDNPGRGQGRSVSLLYKFPSYEKVKERLHYDPDDIVEAEKNPIEIAESRLQDCMFPLEIILYVLNQNLDNAKIELYCDTGCSDNVGEMTMVDNVKSSDFYVERRKIVSLRDLIEKC